LYGSQKRKNEQDREKAGYPEVNAIGKNQQMWEKGSEHADVRGLFGDGNSK
jgi:hypothetical protein